MEANAQGLPVYIPNAPVCHMPQYRCCKREHCRLYHRCSQARARGEMPCIHDCPTCTYTGCSLPPEKRANTPIYRSGVVQGEPLDLRLELRRWREQVLHRKTHQRLYVMYNSLFGDLTERRNARQRERYWANPERAREVARIWYRKHRASASQRHPNESHLPECGFRCEECPHDDCIVPENWYRRNYNQRYYAEHPEYFSEYREIHRAERSEYNKQWYREHREEKLARQKLHRAEPKVKAQRAEYDKKWQKDHPDLVRAKRARYYERHRDEINARRRAKRAAQRHVQQI